MAELLAVPLKKTSDVDIVKPLKNLIQATYSTSESNEDYTEALNELSRLRTNAVWKATEKSSLEVIYSYYDQLVSLEKKIPPQEVQIPFKWKDAFYRRAILGTRVNATVSSLAYERVCVLFNIAALHSAIAAAETLDTEDALKNATKLLQQAAGMFQYLRSNVTGLVHQETTPDLSPDALAPLAALMLAQAQELVATKCIRDEMKESMIAKVCAQAEELYNEAARALSREPYKNLWERDWLPNVAAKKAAFRGLTQLYQSAASRTEQNFGEEIARLQIAVEQLKQAASKLSTWTALSEALARAERQLGVARRDNDFIYHARVPDQLDLEPVQRAAVAKPLPLPDKLSQHRDLFAALVPLSVHGALQAAAARRGDLVNSQVATLREHTQLLNSILASLNLPACLESCAGSSLPASLRDKAASVRAAGGAEGLQALMRDLPDLLRRNKEILDETQRMLAEEAATDEKLRAQYGARWTRTDSRTLTTSLRANADKYAQIIDNAVRADDIVQHKYNQHRQNIALLCGSEEAMLAGVPAATSARSEASSEAAPAHTLRQLMTQVERLKSERDQLETELKDVTVDLREQFLAALAADGALDEPALSTAAIGSALKPLQDRAKSSLEQQERLVAAIQGAHADLMQQVGGASSRDQALGALAAAHDAYHELLANLNEGVKFYNDLTQLLIAFQNKVSDFCFARRTEKEELLKELTQQAAHGSVPPPAPPTSSQQPAHEEAMIRREAPPPPQPAPAAATQLPYPQQPQGMPLPFGAPYPYMAPAPLPALYNPYATLPYPHHRGPAAPGAPGAPAAPPAHPHYQPYQYPPPPPHYNPYQHQ